MKLNWGASHWRATFLAGLAVVLPAVVSVAVLLWLFGTVAGFTDTLLFFVPRAVTRQGGTGPIHWYWSLAALVLALCLIYFVGMVATHYIGKRIIQFFDSLVLRVPLLNKIYSIVKQVNEALTPSNQSSFRTVVLVEFPAPGMQTLGFITRERVDDSCADSLDSKVLVFVPTTPNPTTGFLVLVSEDKITRLDMPVADGVKAIISLGAIVPEFRPATPALKRGNQLLTTAS